MFIKIIMKTIDGSHNIVKRHKKLENLRGQMLNKNVHNVNIKLRYISDKLTNISNYLQNS